LGHADFAGFPAIRAVVFAIHAEPDALQALAVAAIAVTFARTFRQIALRTENRGLHILPSPPRKAEKLPWQQIPLETTIGQPIAPEQAARALLRNSTATCLVSPR
jgi:hypothetical protein